MCLESKQKKSKTSLRRIGIYKVLIKLKDENRYYTPYQYFPVKLDRLYKNQENAREDIMTIKEGVDIYGGFYHAYLNYKEAVYTAEALKSFNHLRHLVVVKGYIPMFTKYYKGKHGDIAAKKIKYKKEIYEI